MEVEVLQGVVPTSHLPKVSRPQASVTDFRHLCSDRLCPNLILQPPPKRRASLRFQRYLNTSSFDSNYCTPYWVQFTRRAASHNESLMIVLITPSCNRLEEALTGL